MAVSWFMRFSTVLCWLVILCLAVAWWFRYSLVELDNTVVQELASPDGSLVIQEFRSNRDGFDHAPYGQMLVLSRKPTRNPEDGYVFFAGYCQKLSYAWEGMTRVNVQCLGDDTEPRTLSTQMYGIEVQYRAGVVRNAKHQPG